MSEFDFNTELVGFETEAAKRLLKYFEEHPYHPPPERQLGDREAWARLIRLFIGAGVTLEMIQVELGAQPGTVLRWLEWENSENPMPRTGTRRLMFGGLMNALRQSLGVTA